MIKRCLRHNSAINTTISCRRGRLADMKRLASSIRSLNGPLYCSLQPPLTTYSTSSTSSTSSTTSISSRDLTSLSLSSCSSNIHPISVKNHLTTNEHTSNSFYVYTTQQNRYKSFQATNPLYKEETPAKEDGKNDNTGSTDDGEIPDYQNPIHHNDPEQEKVFFDDYDTNETPEIVPMPPLSDGSDSAVADPHLHDLAEEILQLSMYEMKELVDRVADHFGIEESDDDDLGVGGDGGGDGADAAEEVKEEKTAFDLKLTAFDAKAKIKVIKEIRAMTGLGLKEAKEMVEGAPKVVKKDIKKEEAEELKEKLEALGATVEIE